MQTFSWLVENLSVVTGTVPAKLLLQLTTAFQKGGLCDRSGTFFYKDHLHKTNVPVLALAGDQDRICPPDAVFGRRITLLQYDSASLMDSSFSQSLSSTLMILMVQRQSS